MTPEVDSVEWLEAGAEEELHWVGRPDLSPVVPFVVIAVGVSLLGVLLATVIGPAAGSEPVSFVLIGFFIGIGLFVVGWRFAQRRSVAYAITTDAVYKKTGTSAVDVSAIALTAIESTSIDRSALARIVDRGTVRIYAPTADRPSLTLEGISRPSEVRAFLTDRDDTPDAGRDAADAGPDTLDTALEAEERNGTGEGENDESEGNQFIWVRPSDEDERRFASAADGDDPDVDTDGASNGDDRA